MFCPHALYLGCAVWPDMKAAVKREEMSCICMVDGTRSDSFKLQQEEFRLGTKKTFLTVG